MVLYVFLQVTLYVCSKFITVNYNCDLTWDSPCERSTAQIFLNMGYSPMLAKHVVGALLFSNKLSQ